MMALRTTLHATVAALILVSSHAISTALEALGTNSDGGFIPPAGVPNAQLEVQEQLKALGIPVYGLQIDLKSTRGPSLSPSPDKQLVKRTAHIGISPLRAIQFQAYYGIDVQVGGRTFRMLVDTGSSDLWLPSENITCVDGNFKEVPQSQCNFTQFTPPTYSGGQIPDRNFNITYAIGATFLGTAGYESVSIGGLTVKKQTVAKVKIAHREASPAGNWNGIFGLGFPNSTNVFPGLDPTKDNRTYPDPHNSIPYNPWVVSAFEDGVIEKPVFTLLLGPRGINDGEIAGSMIIGGAAPSHSVRYGGVCASTKLRVYKPPYRNYFWDFVPDGMKIGDRFIPWEERTRYDDGMHAYDVDSGNDFTWLPNSTMDPWLSSFDPPSITDSRGSYAPCNATFASVAIRIGGKDIPFINSSLLLQPPYGAVNGTPGYCWTGIQPWGYTLGATFLSSVAATFDMTPGSERMVFSSLAK